MATVVNARDVLLQSASVRLIPATPFSGSIDFSQVTGTTRPSDNADVSQTALNSGVTLYAGGITLSSGGAIRGGKSTWGDTTAGFVLGYYYGAYRFQIGNADSFFQWTGTALEMAGNITGASNVDITGQARFRGYNVGSTFTYAVIGNDSYASQFGFVGYSAVSGSQIGAGVWGIGSDVANGVIGSVSGTGAGGSFSSQYSYGTGGTFSNGQSGPALTVSVGTMTINNNSMVANLNADMVDGYHAYQFGIVGATNSGLNSDTLDGWHLGDVTWWADNRFATIGHTHSNYAEAHICDTGTAYPIPWIHFISGVGGYQFSGAGNGVTYQAVSDRRLKRDILPETFGLDFINKLLPVSYRMKNDGRGVRQHGFIYQDMKELVPLAFNDALARENSDGTGSSDTIALIAPLTLAVQQLSKKLTALSDKVSGIKH